MPDQSTETSLINKIAIAAASSASEPTVPDKRSNVASWVGFTTIGSIDAGDDANLGEDNVEVTLERVISEIRATRQLSRDDIILIQNSVDAVSFSCYDGSEALMTLDSTISVVSNEAQHGTTLTARTLVVEVNGLWYEYYPRVALFLDGESGGFGEGGEVITSFTALVMRTAAYPSGSVKKFYQAA